MARLSLLRSGAAALALCLVATAAGAQEFVPGPTPTADALAEQIRVINANPRNASALITAGDLAAKLGDAAAALSFFTRAEAIEPRNPRIAAGRAGLLVMMERPGEALRLFAQAESAGAVMTPYLSQRGLAYDLTGQSGYAQRDYRGALLAQPDDDETVRRLALSLGISGRRDEALALLDPLLRKSDRAAWRARACILAIGGDMAGAAKIAASMIPGGAGLGGFFARLQWLSPADRAFAVHFGDITPSAARAADARLAPAVTPLTTDVAPLPAGPAASASLGTDAVRPPVRRAGERTAAVQPAAEQSSVASASVVRPSRSTQRSQTASREVARLPATSQAPRSPQPSTGSASASSWVPDGRASTATVSSPAASTSSSAGSPASAATPNELLVIDAPRRGSAPSRRTPPRTAVQSRPITPVQTAAAPPPSAPRPTTGNTPAGTSPAPAASVPVVTQQAAPPPVASRSEVVSAAANAQQGAAAPTATSTSTASQAAQRRHANTELLAAIVSQISVPADELEVPPISTPTATAPTPSAVQSERRPAGAATAAPATRSDEPIRPEPKAAAAKPQVEAKTAEARRAAAAKLAETKRAEAAKLAEAKKKADAEKANAARWWVQVAGGARAADLDKDWKRVSTGSAALKGKSPYTTPLRATNRLLTGPFKTEAEARAVVNALAKEGKSSFTFQSAVGQKVDRLGVK